ncbi:MAG: hypothetical protein ACE5JP_00190 [Candidatus Bipolaricaulia bacterium]
MDLNFADFTDFVRFGGDGEAIQEALIAINWEEHERFWRMFQEELKNRIAEGWPEPTTMKAWAALEFELIHGVLKRSGLSEAQIRKFYTIVSRAISRRDQEIEELIQEIEKREVQWELEKILDIDGEGKEGRSKPS